MIITILIVIFSIVACVESSAYGLYEIRVNKNKVRWNCINPFFSCWTCSAYCYSFEYVKNLQLSTISYKTKCPAISC